MKILYTVHQFYPLNYTGTEKFVLNSAKMQQKNGHRVKVISYGMEGVDQYNQTYDEIVFKEFVFEGIPVIEFRNAFKVNHLNENIYDDDCINFANYILDREKPDLLHVGHTMRVSEIVKAASKRGIPYILTLTDFWLFCSQTIMVDKNCNICLGSDEGKICVSKCGYNKYYSMERYRIAKDILLNAYCVVSPSKFLAQMFEKEFSDLKVLVINHGMPYSYLQFNEKIYTKHSKITFCYAGSLTSHKGVHLIIEAMHRNLPACKIKIYGGGPSDYVEKLKGEIGEKDDIELNGPYRSTEISKVFSNCDVIIVPSMWYENYPLVLHEALASGVPVIASDIGGMSEKIKDNFNGLTFRVGSSDDLAKKMKIIIENPEMLNKFKENIKFEVQPTIEQEAYQYKRIIEKISMI